MATRKTAAKPAAAKEVKAETKTTAAAKETAPVKETPVKEAPAKKAAPKKVAPKKPAAVHGLSQMSAPAFGCQSVLGYRIYLLFRLHGTFGNGCHSGEFHRCGSKRSGVLPV